MKRSTEWRMNTSTLVILCAALFAFAGCVPLETAKPTLNEVRLGNARGPTADDTRLRPGEVRGEVTEINRARQEIYVVTDDGRRQIVPYDFDRTRVVYHGWDYAVDDLEAGDRIVYQPVPRGSRYIDVVRIQEPVQARSGSSRVASNPPRPRTDVVEGTVERIDHNLGVFDVLPPAGRPVTVSVPYNARPADVDSFRGLRRGDPVRIEGQFVSPSNLQLLSFLSAR